MVDSKDLSDFASKQLQGRTFVVALQREPYSHVHTPNGKIKIIQGEGGAHVLMNAMMKNIGGFVVARASGNADMDVVDEKNRVKVPNSKGYTLKRIFIKKKELDGFYYGFANQVLWPLSHVVFVKPVFNPAWWQDYLSVNMKFADAILEELADRPGFVWVNDYHLALVPKLLKQKHKDLSVGTFWHIPWPTHEIFRICPWRKEIIEGLLGSDFIGFHRGYHVDNFIECVRRELEVRVDSEPRSIHFKDHETNVAYLPAGIDFDEVRDILNKKKRIDKRVIKTKFGFDYEYLAIGVDRIDYTKGLVERMKIIERFLEKYPEYIGKFTYLSIAPPSRLKIPAYKNLNRELYDVIERINWKYSTNDWQPIHVAARSFPREDIFSFLRLADTCLVTSLDDGMNLVAKEYVLACKPHQGMLLLSKFTGAAKDLKQALLINPYDIEASADAIYQSLTMSPDEKFKRNTEMKEILREHNIYNWGIDFIRKTLNK